MPVTLRDIAKQVGLSHATVSFVLNQRLDVAIPEATRQRVFAAAREMGYRPNSLARALVSGRTLMVAICLPVLRHPYYVGVFHSLFEICQQNGYSVLVYQSSRGPTRRAFDWPVDGVIAADSVDMIRRGEVPGHLPIVSIGANVDTGVDHVQIDLREGAVMALEHLVAIGCERIVHVRVMTSPDPAEEREFAYDEVLRESGRLFPTIVVERPQPELVRAAVRGFVETEGKPDAFFCTNDLSAMATLRGMADLGFFSPRDYKVVGFDGIDEGEMMVPSITTVSQPVPAMCREAVEFLLNRVRDPKIGVQSASLTSTLVIRESTSSGA
jgi:LacI family transcriptional regulator, galactose operon repressor